MKSGFQLLTVAAALAATSCGDNLCQNIQGTCIAVSAGTPEADIEKSLVTAGANTTIVFGAGTFTFSNTLSCSSSSSNLTITGQGKDKTSLDFKGQTAGAQGIYCNANGFTLSNLAVKNTPGDGVKVEGADTVTFRNVAVSWSGDPTTHGAYGLYPVQSVNVLIEGCSIDGAADAGVYVGQSDKIIVRNNVATNNVAGIEIENSTNADVTNNESHDNTGGILVFALPGLQKKVTKTVHVTNNHIYKNNGANFADKSSIVHNVPAGTGMLIMAADTVEIDNNKIENNSTAGIGIVSYYVAKQDWMPSSDPGYPIFPNGIWVHDNSYTMNGSAPDPTTQIGAGLLATFTSGPAPTVMWDGIPDPTHSGANPQHICLSGTGSPSWANLDAGDPAYPPPPFHYSTDATAYSCSATPLPPLMLPQDVHAVSAN